MIQVQRRWVGLLVACAFLTGWAGPAGATQIDVSISQNPGNVMIPEQSLSLGGDVASDDAFVYGTIEVDTPTTLYVSVSAVHVVLHNGGQSITATLRGTIGNVSASTTPQPISVSPGDPATINLVLDIDESSLSAGKRSGVYSSSSIQILATE
jgi:hypothetical protein